MCPNAAYTVSGSGIGTSQCWVLPGTGVPPLQALISPSSIAPTSAPNRWVTSAIAAARSHSGPDSPARAGQFRRRRQLAV